MLRKFLKVFILGAFICNTNAKGLLQDEMVQRADIYYEMITRNGEKSESKLENVEDFDSSKDIKVIIHGFLASRNEINIKELDEAYVDRGDVNVLMADWQEAALMDYISARNSVEEVAIYFANHLNNFLVAKNISVSKVHLIGHSLGAHVAGNIGKFFKGQINRITGLDPALPLFTANDGDSLQPSDAQFVDVIHTNSGVYGDKTPRGTVDFYPSFGVASQPGCSILFSNVCSHIRAISLFTESVRNSRSFPSIPCTMSGIDSKDIKKCSSERNLSNSLSDSSVIYMGDQTPRSARGIFYLSTREKSYFGIGVNSSS